THPRSDPRHHRQQQGDRVEDGHAMERGHRVRARRVLVDRVVPFYFMVRWFRPCGQFPGESPTRDGPGVSTVTVLWRGESGGSAPPLPCWPFWGQLPMRPRVDVFGLGVVLAMAQGVAVADPAEPIRLLDWDRPAVLIPGGGPGRETFE